jgi:hypothetical protein
MKISEFEFRNSNLAQKGSRLSGSAFIRDELAKHQQPKIEIRNPKFY